MTTYRYTAESWDEFVHDLRTRPVLWKSYNADSSTVAYDDWWGSQTWDEALQYAVSGHPVARAAIEGAAVKVTSSPEPLWDTAPVGAFPCIPAHAAGVPEDMFAMSDIAPPVQSPIVRIVVNMSASSTVDPESIVNRGAAIVTLIDQIQASGRRVELIAVKHGHSKKDRYVWQVTIKRPEEPIDMDRIGLAFATPIMLRRFFFRVMEFITPREVYGHGYSAHFPDECSGADLVIPNITGNEYSTPDRANALVLALWELANRREAA
jgi:hypothetical protein